MNDQERLEFAVSLAQTDLSTLRAGDWLNLREDLMVFIIGEGATGETKKLAALPLETPYPQEYSRDDFAALQKDVYAVLNDLASARDKNYVFKTNSTQITVRFGAVPSKERAVLGVQGSTRDTFLYRLSLLLLLEPSNRILRCKTPDCNRIFYRVRKQKYCSTRCQSRDFMRTFRKRNGETESEKNHKRYKKRVETARGRPTRVARRPRKNAERAGGKQKRA